MNNPTCSKKEQIRLIDANALFDFIFTCLPPNASVEAAEAYFDVRRMLLDESVTPTIDPESLRPQGTWIGEADGYADGELVYDVWYCSECNHCIDDGTDDPDLLPNYCPNCGAKMREE